MAYQQGITFIMVTHEPELASCADRVITLLDGVVQSDHLLPVKEIEQNRAELFRELEETQE